MMENAASLHAAWHASCVVIAESAILVRGPAGSGKSALCLALMGAARGLGLFARLVADDRVLVAAHGGRLVARPHPTIAGLIERRGLGLTPLAHEGSAVVRLLIDLEGEPPPRLPEPEALVVRLQGVTVPRLALQGGSAGRSADPGLVLAALALLNDEFWAKPGNQPPF